MRRFAFLVCLLLACSKAKSENVERGVPPLEGGRVPIESAQKMTDSLGTRGGMSGSGSLPPGHPPIDEGSLPEGHPMIDEGSLPEGHPAIPSGHPNMSGGGGGMVMTAPPWLAAVRALASDRAPWRLLLSPQGRRLDEGKVRELAGRGDLLLLCGRYEGIDERVRQTVVDEEISIGDFVVSGGELPAMVLIEAVSRQIPGVVQRTEIHHVPWPLQEAKAEFLQNTVPASHKIKIERQPDLVHFSKQIDVVVFPPVVAGTT
jgi:hypothetical protein